MNAADHLRQHVSTKVSCVTQELHLPLELIALIANIMQMSAVDQEPVEINVSCALLDVLC